MKTNIDWADYTVSPEPGCYHACPYCYGAKLCRRFWKKWGMKPDFSPAWFPERLAELSKIKAGIVFVNSMGDLFGKWVPDANIAQTIQATIANPHDATFTFLTKDPARYTKLRQKGFEFGLKSWLGATLDAGYESRAPRVGDRVKAMSELHYPRKWLSIEPLHFDYSHWYFDELAWQHTGIGWVVIGCETANGVPVPKGHQPDVTDIDEIIHACKLENIPVFVKNSIFELFPGKEFPREFPAGVQLATKSPAHAVCGNYLPLPLKARQLSLEAAMGGKLK